MNNIKKLSIVIIGLSILFSQLSFATQKRVALFKIQIIGSLQQNSNIIARDGGISGLVGKQPFWTFGDTLYNNKHNKTFTTMTGGYGKLQNPRLLINAASQGTQPQTIAFSTAEMQYNSQHNNPNQRIAIWPAGVIPISQNQSYVFFNAVKINPGFLNYQQLYFGIAKLNLGHYTAVRLNDCLFKNSKITLNAQFIQKQTIYFTSCRVAAFKAPCKIAKVNYREVKNQNHYLWWSKISGWTNDYAKASDVFDGSTTGLSIAYNAYMKKYVSAYATFFDNTILIRTAKNITGPWSKPEKLYLPVVSAGTRIYAVSMHPEYDPSGKTILISYYQPQTNLLGHIQLLHINFNIINFSINK